MGRPLGGSGPGGHYPALLQFAIAFSVAFRASIIGRHRKGPPAIGGHKPRDSPAKRAGGRCKRCHPLSLQLGVLF